MAKENIIIGIDPDVNKSGVATLSSQGRKLDLSALDFPHLCEYLSQYRDADAVVLIEAGWLNRSNWHLMSRMSVQKAAQIGNATGRNHEVGRKIAEMCAYYGVAYKLIKPLKKVWRGADGKITAKEFEQITSTKIRTNQEMRDAGLIAWFY